MARDNFKDGLSFVSFVGQIESGIKAGYKESEIAFVQLVQELT